MLSEEEEILILPVSVEFLCFYIFSYLLANVDNPKGMISLYCILNYVFVKVIILSSVCDGKRLFPPLRFTETQEIR